MLVLHLHCLQPQNVDNRVDQTRLCSGIYLGYCTRRFDRIFVGILLLLLKKRQHSADQRTSVGKQVDVLKGSFSTHV